MRSVYEGDRPPSRPGFQVSSVVFQVSQPDSKGSSPRLRRTSPREGGLIECGPWHMNGCAVWRLVVLCGTEADRRSERVGCGHVRPRDVCAVREADSRPARPGRGQGGGDRRRGLRLPGRGRAGQARRDRHGAVAGDTLVGTGGLANPLHTELAEAGEAAAIGAGALRDEVRVEREGRGQLTSVTVARREIRDWLSGSEEGFRVEELVSRLLGV